MKRLIYFILILSCTPGIFAQQAIGNPQAVITEITGTVEIKQPGYTEWVSAGTGDVIDTQAVISTGFRSTALISVGSTTLYVRPLTRMSLESLLTQNDTETVQINLNTGRMRIEVKPPAGTKASFTVQTTTAVASVRGTAFEMDTANIRVTEGCRVLISNHNKENGRNTDNYYRKKNIKRHGFKIIMKYCNNYSA